MVAPGLATQELLDLQLKTAEATEQGKEKGSRAIAYGRVAGLAMELGNQELAGEYWKKIIGLSADYKLLTDIKFPSLVEVADRYKANPQKFEAFNKEENFKAGGTAFSNAIGSYAYAFDVIRRGNDALAGGEMESACKWGADALRAAGYEDKAEALETLATGKAAKLSGESGKERQLGK